jgi:hypothetical protein
MGLDILSDKTLLSGFNYRRVYVDIDDDTRDPDHDFSDDSNHGSFFRFEAPSC